MPATACHRAVAGQRLRNALGRPVRGLRILRRHASTDNSKLCPLA
jgi:hypothetical protein